MNNFYVVGGHAFCLRSDDPQFVMPDAYSPFRVEGGDDVCPLFVCMFDDDFRFESLGREIGQFDCADNVFGVYRKEDGGYQFELSDDHGKVCALLESDVLFSRNKIALVAEDDPGRVFGLNNALMLCYSFASAPFGTLLMHSSVVKWNNRGYLFLGTSGTGKSTHSQLWLRHIERVDLINDDNPVVRVVDGLPHVYGSPWSGKTPCYRNMEATVGAFVQLSQYGQNIMCRMGVLESLSSLLQSISTMKWDVRLYGAHVDTLKKIIGSTKFFHLKCLPDRDAALLCQKMVAEG